MPRNYNEMPNDILLNMAIMGDQEAREERLIREIMAVDNVDWKTANNTFQLILASNRRVSDAGHHILTILVLLTSLIDP